MKQHLMITLLAIAGSLTFGELLNAQLPGGPPNKVLDLRGNGQANSQIQSQIQQQVQGQVQSQIQAQANARMQADVNRAADLAQRAAATAQRQATAARNRIAGSARIELSANASARGEQRNERGMLEASGHAQASAQLRLPPGFAEADVELYDRIFGKHNPIRTQEPRSDESQGAGNGLRVDNGLGVDNGMKIRAVNYEESGTDLAEQIHLAIQQRRAEISEMRDRALVETKPELLEQADQMELVMDTFVEAQARAKAKADARASGEIENRLDERGDSTLTPNGESMKSIDQAGEVESSSESKTESETNGSIRGKRK